jgi:hypothetical protein
MADLFLSAAVDMASIDLDMSFSFEYASHFSASSSLPWCRRSFENALKMRSKFCHAAWAASRGSFLTSPLAPRG